MAKFKVGDRVRVVSTSPGCFFAPGDTGIIYHDDGSNYRPLYVKFDNHSSFGWVCESEIEPLAAIPAGWAPADEPPDGIRDVLVMLKGGEKRLGWYSESAIISGGNWYLYPEGTTPKSIDDDDTSFDDTPAAPGEVLAWCEIEPAAKARYVVCAIPTEHDTLEEAELHAQRAVESSRVNVVIARVVEEVKPGKPEVIRMEE